MSTLPNTSGTGNPITDLVTGGLSLLVRALTGGKKTSVTDYRIPTLTDAGIWDAGAGAARRYQGQDGRPQGLAWSQGNNFKFRMPGLIAR
jgi:hypothetical protein